jgi:hypothetical protein
LQHYDSRLTLAVTDLWGMHQHDDDGDDDDDDDDATNVS